MIAPVAPDHFDNGQLTERIAFITGAASGIGLATARRFVEEGACVALVDRDAERLDEAAAGLGSRALAVNADVACRDQVRDAVAATVARFGRVDVVVNNAAVVDNWGPPTDVGPDIWDDVLRINLRGVVEVCNAAIAHMDRGSIVNTSSICGALRACPNRSPYTSAKAAIIAYTRDLAAAYGPQGIRSNVVVPGFIDTPMSRRLVAGHEDAAAAEERRIPLRRQGRADEVANATLFLASEAASYVNGSVLVIDGGLNVV